LKPLRFSDQGSAVADAAYDFKLRLQQRHSSV
jgi:hypothetical protein